MKKLKVKLFDSGIKIATLKGDDFDEIDEKLSLFKRKYR